MNVSAVSYNVSHGADNVSHNVRYEVTINDEGDCSLYQSRGVLGFEGDNPFLLTGFGEDGINHYFRKLDQCPFFEFALLDSWSWSGTGVPAGSKKYICECVYISDPIYSTLRKVTSEKLENSYVIQRREIVAEKAWDPEDDSKTDPDIPIQTTAGEQFISPPLKTYENELVFNIGLWFPIASSLGNNTGNVQSDLLEFINTINTEPLTLNGFDIPAKHCLIDSVQPEIVYTIVDSGQGNYERVADLKVLMKLVVKFTPHVLEILNAGYIGKQSDTATKFTRIKVNGDYPQSPVKLDENGVIADTTGAGYEPLYLDFQLNKAVPFNSLGLPISFAPDLDNPLYDGNN